MFFVEFGVSQLSVAFVDVKLFVHNERRLSYNSPEEVRHGRTKYWQKMHITDSFAAVSSSYCGVSTYKIIRNPSSQACTDPTSDVYIVAFSFSI